MVVAMNRALMPDYFALAGEIRAAGIQAEVYLGKKGIGAQMKYADRRGIDAVIIVGEDELSAGQVSIKDMAAGRRLSADVADRETWRKERPAQVTVARQQMIERLQQILAPEEP
jgi:histidyl-tRNA synthetase